MALFRIYTFCNKFLLCCKALRQYSPPRSLLHFSMANLFLLLKAWPLKYICLNWESFLPPEGKVMKRPVRLCQRVWTNVNECERMWTNVKEFEIWHHMTCTPNHGHLAARSWGQGGSRATWEWPTGLLDISNAWYSSPWQLWLVHDPVALTMAAWQPNLGAREGLDPLGSDLESC